LLELTLVSKQQNEGANSTTTARVSQKLPEAPRMLISFECNECNTRNTKYMSKQAYASGVVLIECEGCQNRHLIADNLGWFGDKSRNIEDIMKEKGELVEVIKSRT
jgi:protein import protein ZIM17